MITSRLKLIWTMYLIAVFSIAIALFILFKPDHRTRLYVYNWSDYIDPDVIAAFEKENDCQIIIDTFSDNESMLAKLMSGGTGYDVIFPSSYVVPVMVRQKFVRKLDMDKLPNVKKYFDAKYKPLLHDDSLVYSVPYAFSMTGIAYRKDKVPEGMLKHSWYDLMCPAFGKRVSLLRDMREMLGIGLIATGHDVNTSSEKDLEDSLTYLKQFKKHISKLDNEMYRTALVNGELYACIGYNSDIVQVMTENEDCPIGFFIPADGSTCCWDEMVISASTTKGELAHAFINYLYDPEVAAKNLAYTCSVVPNTEMWNHVDDEFIHNYLVNVPDETINRLFLIKDVGENIRLFNAAWDKFMSSK